jgi:integrase
MTYLAPGAADAVEAWLRIRTDTPGALFVPIDKAGRLTVRAMTPAAVYGVMRKRGARAGVEFTPHDARRSFTSGLLEGGADIATVAKLLGHASVTTTARYDHRGERAKRQAVDVLHVPYQRP